MSYEDLRDYIDERCDKHAENNHWIWLLDSPYSSFRGNVTPAARATWTAYKRQPPTGRIQRICDNNDCVNPDHHYDTNNASYSSAHQKKQLLRKSITNMEYLISQADPGHLKSDAWQYIKRRLKEENLI